MGRIVDLADLIAYGNLDEDKLDGQMLEALLDSAETFVEKFCGRRFSPDPPLDSNGMDTAAPVTKTFTVSYQQRVVRVPDLRSVTTMLLNGTNLAFATGWSGGYRLDQYDNDPSTRVYITYPTWWYQLPAGALAVTGRWGWLVAPDPIQYAVKALVMRMYRERDAAWADSVATPDGSVLSYFRQLPSSIQGTLSLYASGPKVALV